MGLGPVGVCCAGPVNSQAQVLFCWGIQEWRFELRVQTLRVLCALPLSVGTVEPTIYMKGSPVAGTALAGESR